MHEQLVQRAQGWAVRLWHNYFGCEHLLLVLVEDGKLDAYSVTTDDVVRELRVQLLGWVSEADALRAIGFDPLAMKQNVGRELGAEIRIQGIDTRELLSPTPRARRVLETAATDDDVLYAMLREDTNLGVVILEHLGVPIKQLILSLEPPRKADPQAM